MPNIRSHRLDETPVYYFKSGITHSQNELIVEDLFAARDQWHFSHRIKGRWENTYVPFHLIRSARIVLNLAERAANQINGNHLVIPRRALGLSFDDYWFNIARPGESTALHHHSHKATLSGVYYLQVPPSSGNIQFPVRDGGNYEIPVEAGLMVIFPSRVRHAVSRNESGEKRVSMAFNLYQLPLEC